MVGLLWKVNYENLRNSRATAMRRLQLLEKRLDRDKDYAEKYYFEMDWLFQNGFAEQVVEPIENTRVWYLPHHGVQNINKPGKVRLVFDASARTTNVSLNELLLPGPDILKSLPGVLMRFQQFAFAIKGDIKDMFLKIKMRKVDQNAQRFLWRGKKRNEEPTEYAMTTLLFGSKSSPCSALYIKNVNAACFESQYPSIVKSLIGNCYMDDYLDSCVRGRSRVAYFTSDRDKFTCELANAWVDEQLVIRIKRY